MMSRLRFPLYIFFIATNFAVAQNTYSEDVAMPVGVQGNDSVHTPGRAWTQAKVQENFGAPISRRGPVGDPAITVWDYGEFSVYFEHDRVLHSVRHYQTAQN